MNSRPVNYSPSPTARFAEFPTCNCDWFSVACPRREIAAVCTSSFSSEYFSSGWQIHSSLTLAVEGIRLNRTRVNSIVSPRIDLGHCETGAQRKRRLLHCASSYFLSFIRSFPVKCMKYIIENLSVKNCRLQNVKLINESFLVIDIMEKEN